MLRPLAMHPEILVDATKHGLGSLESTFRSGTLPFQLPMRFPSLRRLPSKLDWSLLPSPPPCTTTTKTRASEQRCLALLQRCSTLLSLLQIQTHILKSGLHADILLLTKFTSTSSSIGAPPASAASLLFDPTSPVHLYDTFLFNTVIRSFALSDTSKEDAILYFSFMLRCGIPPNNFTYPFLLKACAGSQDLEMGLQVHGSCVRSGFQDDPYVQNTLIHMYSACGSAGIGSARKVFDGMLKMSHVTWSAMIGGYVRSGLSSEAVAVFREMQVMGVRPDEITIISVLSACADVGALELGKWIGSYVERERIPRTLELCNALVDMLAKCGDIDGAVAFFNQMPEKSIISWTTVIDGLAMHGQGRAAVAVFEAMNATGVVPDDVAFIGVLSACSHAGMVDEGCRYFNLMRKRFNIKPKIEHYGCMVDLFTRAGLIDRAVDFIRSMPFKPNSVIMRTLVGACRLHGKLDLGISIIQQLIDDEPMQGSNYVISSNFFASMRQWERKLEIRKAMGKKGIWKVPGCSSLEIDGEIYEFVAGDNSHPNYKVILKMVDEVGRELKQAGHTPTTSEVLLDIDEEDKEDVLHRHSEKLAIAFALLRTAPGTPIRIVKNLRICFDCHSATKFISKVYNREIVVRDRNRFHRFKDGECSCKDFW